ncbi:SdiA-regulated domain-containing protein [Novosphingobium sp. JCM 18896]|uniref:SdiA-regulated domain-containing protein n=1 Tax=Novosphingobium sp. JCM 18896 TaxID=2989731 RepID=UPI00222358F3|nr:SdiA-regulated domain-containing protein [Novosphingobium sp. JCM 18896]MCW1430761.1 SdiA-regulated domain-containing protein [Novosphingobium sp. JCM 18896]
MTKLTSTGTAATENFDSLAASGASSALPSGWFLSESGTSATVNQSYTAGTGSGTAGDTYSFGAANGTDRALGTLLSGTNTPTIGAEFVNETGQTLTSLLIAYTGEQWRLGATGRKDQLDFQISFDATSLTTGTWTDIDALDFVAPVQAGTAGALDGNAAANRTDISSTVALDNPLAAGAKFWIRWTDFNANGSDDGLAIDNFAITANPGPVTPTPGVFGIAAGSAAEGAGFVELKVTRSGGSAGAATLDYLVSAGTANAADFVGNALPQGQVSFADGQTEATIKIAVVNDTIAEADETFTVTLANATAGTIGTAAATGKILNDDAQQIAIYQIQGEAHKSAYAGQSVTTTGVVTAVASNGFYLQDKTGDGNARTSDAIFVFTTTAPSVQVGNEATVTGKVEEFLPGGSAANLTTTEIVATAVSVAKDTGGQALVHALPDAVVIGTGGLLPPTDTFDDDQFAVYDPQNDAADFFESLEGMRVTVDAPIVVDRTNSFGETYVVASGGAGATGLNDRGGMTISGNANGFDDYNPERIQLDDSSLSGFNGKYTQGDELSDVTGIINYDFQSYELLVTGAVTVTKDVAEPTRETTTLVGDATHLTMATYNVENLDPGDNKFTILARDIAYNLRAPDVIALQEIQDKDGAGNGSDLSGYVTAKGLIDAIKALGGPEYVYIEITPSAAGTTGGEPGGNIRNGFLYNPGRVDYVEGSAELITGVAFANSRNPLAATFEFNGEEVTAISVHSSSRGGSDPLFGATQPPVNGAEAARIAQSEAIRDYVEDLIGADTEARVAVLGDFNGFYFEQSLELLEAGGLLTNLHRTLPEEERYSYMFGSNAQALDNVLVSNALYQNVQFDAVHINSEQPDTAARGTDHDPLVASFEIKGETPLSVDLSTYVRTGRYDLPTTAAGVPASNKLATEASAITYNWDKDSLFVVGDGTTAIVEISKTGQLIGSMTLTAGAFDDIEGLAYVGNGKFVMVEERTRSVISFEYTAGGSLVRTDTQVVKLGTTTGNVGLEGVTYDPATGGYIFVKESDPQGIFQTTVDFANGTASNGSATTANSTNLFDPAKLALGDMADVFALSNLSTIGTSERGNLLVLSQESGKILEVDRAGNVLSSLTIIGDPGNSANQQQHEGLAMDKQGNLYVVSENGGGDASHPQLWVYQTSSVPNAAPTAIALTNAATELVENTSTATRFKVADITVTDDQLGNNVFSVTGADAQYFEADASGLYIKAGTVLDYETKASFSVTVQVDDAAVGGSPDATVNYTLTLKDVVNEGSGGNSGLYISEAAPWSSGNSPVGADWFEITNGGTSAVNIAGWKIDDSSKAFSTAVALNGVTSIAAGESVIFIESSSPAAIDAFINTWFGGTKPAGLQIGTYSGSGIGLSTESDALNLYDTTGTLQASITFGAADATAPYQTFNNAAGINGSAVTTLSEVGKNGAFVAAQDSNEIGSPGSVGRLIVSEVAPWSNDNSPFKADWFELTNTSAVAIDITGWKVDDNSRDFTKALALNGITTIKPGESVIFIESADPAIATQFINTWFGGNAPAGLQIGTYTGSGIGLSAGGDQINIYDASGKLQADVTFGASDSTAPYSTFDNTAGLNGTTITQLSATGTNGAFKAINDANEIGSPGGATPPVASNKAPTAITLANATTAIEENTSTATRIKVADVNVTDDGMGTNQLSVTGTDAQYFEVDSTGLYIKAGTVLDYEAKQSYSVTVSVDDVTVGTTPDASTTYTLGLTNVVNETPQGKIAITEVAPWSNDNSPFKADWFELTNTSTVAVNIAGWKVDDDSKAFGSALALNGITTIAPGESVIFIEGAPAIAAQFVDTWFGGVKPAGLQIGTYTGSGIGLGGKGDEVNIYDASGKLQANVAFGAADSTAPYSTFDNTAGLNGTITVLSAVGTNDAFKAINDANEIGSPGGIALNQGTVADGYLSGATVFIDANGNGVLDAGETSTTTDSQGKFSFFSSATGPIRAVGGVNTDTNLPNNLVLSAPDGASVINPLTTLIQTLVDGGKTAAQAEAAVKQAFGLDAGLALTQVDLVAGAANPGSPAFEAQKAAASVAEVLNTVKDNQGDLAAALVALGDLAKNGQPVDLTKTEVLAQVIGAGLPGAAPATLAQLVEETQDVTQAIDQAQDLGDITDVQENEAPVAVNDAVAVTVDATTGNLWSQLLANDTDPDGASTLRIKAVDATGTLGTVVFDAATQTLTYAADDDAFDAIPSGGSATDRFTYTVTDEYGAVHSAQVAVTVNAKPNTAPTDLAISHAAVAENLAAGAVVGTLSAKDTAGDVLTYSLTNNAGGRFAVDAATGQVTTTRAFDYETDKSFQITTQVRDKANAIIEKTIEIAVDNVNEAPTAKADAITIDEDATSGNLWSQLIGNDIDPEGIATLSISAVNASGTKGTVQFDAAAKTLFYIADDESFDDLDSGAKASDSFSYTVTDGQFTSTATVQVSVTGVSDGAIRVGSLRADTLTGTSGEDLIGGLLGNDTLYGLDGNDKLWGGLGNDKLFGGNGNDMLSGDFGDDELDGGAGDDMLYGDTGDDKLTGGAGRDTFGFSLFGGKDTITDFNVAEDRLMLGFGVSVSKTKVSDVNGDGKQDLTLTLGLLGLNGTVTLLGVKDYSLVQIDRGDTFISQSPF